MLKRAELQKCTCSELSAMCKERGLKHYNGKNRFTKPQMIELLLDGEEAPKKEASSVEGKQAYIDKLSVGMLVAFRENEEKINTAAVKVIKRTGGEITQLILETQYKREYRVSPKDILWVKTNGRWPKAIYMALKGGSRRAKKSRIER